MDARTLEALKASIAKWERNRSVDDPLRALIYYSSCPLCDHFFIRNDNCHGCPVAERTGKNACAGSPWDDAEKSHDAWILYPDNDELKSAFRAAARAEVDFLKSLLPPEETK